MEGQAAAVEVPVKLDDSEMGEKRREEKQRSYSDGDNAGKMRFTLWVVVVDGGRRRGRGEGEGEGTVAHQRGVRERGKRRGAADARLGLPPGVFVASTPLHTSIQSTNVNPREWIKVNIYRGVNN